MKGEVKLNSSRKNYSQKPSLIRVKSYVWRFAFLSCFGFNSAFVTNFFLSYFVANVFIFSFKPESLTNIFAVIFTSSKGILFSTVVIGISPLTSFTLALRAEVVAKLVILDILSSISLILALCASFLTTFSLNTSLTFLNQQKQVLTYQHLFQLNFQYLIYQPLLLSWLNHPF